MEPMERIEQIEQFYFFSRQSKSKYFKCDLVKKDVRWLIKCIHELMFERGRMKQQISDQSDQIQRLSEMVTSWQNQAIKYLGETRQ